MSLGFSIGDIILCSQITYRLLTAATSGRKDAPRRLRELDDILLGLSCALHCLQEASITVSSTSNSDGSNIHRQLGLMLHSCRRTLEELENATAKYREADKSSISIHNRNRRPSFSPQEFIAHIKVQWWRFIWDLQEDSLSQYRHRLQSHTDSMNLLLSTLIWSATDRIEEDGRRQRQMIEGLLHQASSLNSALFDPMHDRYHPRSLIAC